MVAMVDHVPKSNSTPIIGSECPGMLNSTEPKHKVRLDSGELVLWVSRRLLADSLSSISRSSES